MRRSKIIAAAAALSLATAASAYAATPKLTGTTGPGFTITLKKAGKKVTKLKAGKYSITVADKSADHNFRLKGPGVNRATSVAKTGTVTWAVTLKRGKYTYLCDPHASFGMKGSFTVS